MITPLLQRQWSGVLLVFSVMSCTQVYTGRSTATSIAPKPASLSTLLESHGYIAVPLEHLTSGLYTMQTRINSTPVALLLDCGFNENIAIVKSFADSLGIHGIPDRIAIGAGGTAMTDTTRLTHFTLGTMRLDSQFVTIFSRLPVLNGLVGAQFYSTHSAIMDYSTGVLYIDGSSSRPFTELPSLAQSRGAVAIPLTRFAKGNPVKVIYTLQAVVGSTSLTLILDTGADQDILIDQQRADALGLRVTSTDVVKGVGGGQEVRVGSIDHLILGSRHLDTLSFMAMDMSGINQRYQSDGFPRIDGILGAGVLTAYHAAIDFGHDMLYLYGQ